MMKNHVRQPFSIRNTSMGSIYLIRHGQASFGEADYDQLSANGEKQSRILAAHLLRVGHRFDQVFSGSMKRHHQTAKETLDLYRSRGMSLPDPVVRDAFNEYDSFGIWNAQVPMMLEEDPSLQEQLEKVFSDRKSFQRLFEKVMGRWTSGCFDTPGLPRWRDFQRNVRAGFQEIMNAGDRGRQVLVFTSGGPISAAVQQALDIDDERTMGLSWQIMNASVTRFKFNESGLALAGFNDITHLELAGDRKLLTYR
jgi:broad specificity phosphatase PhoE